MQRRRVERIPFFRISGHEPSGERVVISGAEVVEAEVRVVLFAAIQVIVWRRSSGYEIISEGIIIVGVGEHTLRRLHNPRRPS